VLAGSQGKLLARAAPAGTLRSPPASAKGQRSAGESTGRGFTTPCVPILGLLRPLKHSLGGPARREHLLLPGKREGLLQACGRWGFYLLGKPFGVCLERGCERIHLLGDRQCLRLRASPGSADASSPAPIAPLGPGDECSRLCLGKHPLSCAGISHGGSEIPPREPAWRGSSEDSRVPGDRGLPGRPCHVGHRARRQPLFGDMEPGWAGAGGVDGLGPRAGPWPLRAAPVRGTTQHRACFGGSCSTASARGCRQAPLPRFRRRCL